MPYWNDCPVQIEEHVPLGELTTWGIGGTARFFARPDNSVALASLMKEARERNLDVRVLGGGSNLLVADAGVNALVLQLVRKGEFGELQLHPDSGMVTVGAAVSLGKLLACAADAGLAGLEPLAGIPGTVGGALRMNAGTRECSIGQFVQAVDVLTADGDVEQWKQKKLRFGYRQSALGDVIALRAHLALRVESADAVRARLEEAADHKKKTQPLGMRTCGCVFKNPPGDAAGRLIDEAGLKGERVGNAFVSTQHANFILNMGGATAAEVDALIEKIRKTVLHNNGIDLQEEVERWA